MFNKDHLNITKAKIVLIHLMVNLNITINQAQANRTSNIKENLYKNK